MKDDKHRELNKTIKQLKAQIRSLRKTNKLLQSELDLLHLLWSDDIAQLKQERREKITEKRAPVCPECGNTTITISQIGVWTLSRCSGCDYFHREQKEMV